MSPEQPREQQPAPVCVTRIREAVDFVQAHMGDGLGLKATRFDRTAVQLKHPFGEPIRVEFGPCYLAPNHAWIRVQIGWYDCLHYSPESKTFIISKSGTPTHRHATHMMIADTHQEMAELAAQYLRAAAEFLRGYLHLDSEQ